MGRAIHDCTYKVKYSATLSKEVKSFKTDFQNCVFDLDFIIMGEGNANPLPVPYIARVEKTEGGTGLPV